MSLVIFACHSQITVPQFIRKVNGSITKIKIAFYISSIKYSYFQIQSLVILTNNIYSDDIMFI